MWSALFYSEIKLKETVHIKISNCMKWVVNKTESVIILFFNSLIIFNILKKLPL